MSDTDSLKREAGKRAAQFVSDGQIVGLGTGSTTRYAIEEIGRLVKEGLKITGVPTSVASEQMAKELGIPLLSLNEIEEIDVTIDGADEINPDFHMIKGGGGALTREKLVALASNKVVIVIDPSKRVPILGASGRYPLPVEVLPFAWNLSARLLGKLGCAWTLREKVGEVFVTDNGNYILDCHFGPIQDPVSLEKEIKLLPGVVENGLFVGIADTLVIGGEDGVEIQERPQ